MLTVVNNVPALFSKGCWKGLHHSPLINTILTHLFVSSVRFMICSSYLYTIISFLCTWTFDFLPFTTFIYHYEKKISNRWVEIKQKIWSEQPDESYYIVNIMWMFRNQDQDHSYASEFSSWLFYHHIVFTQCFYKIFFQTMGPKGCRIFSFIKKMRII